ncbi:hypothetical protein FACS189459_5660 [Bacilli bacterium]|nr:hypothetical protein FACS189459_5660 [Bacilli bacterium]
MNEIDVKIEGNLISELLNNNEAVDEAVLKLKPEYFFDRTYGIIFKVICNLHKKSHHINDVSVKNYFNNNKSIQFDDYEQIIDSLYLNYFTPGAYSENIDYINCH